MKLTVKSLRLLLTLLLCVLQSGCTYVLWTNGDLDAYREPMENPNLHLYESRPKGDVLVVYQEFSERNDAIRTREYWLNKNQKRLEKQHAPKFAPKKSASNLSPIPVFYLKPEKPDPSQKLYAVYEDDLSTFTLFSNGRKIGSYHLPVYNDGWGRVEKTALTPVAVTVDATIVVAIVGVLALYGSVGQDYQIGK